MPRVPSTSPATGNAVSPSYVHTVESNFVDASGRTLFFRGLNLSGATKAPVNHLSHILDDFWQSAEAGGESFVGRPLNLDDGSADIHLARLRAWGFNLFRFPVTWEALEHEGPGKYDYDYMDYVVRVLQKCKDYGFRVFIDPHQDTWSRFSGGSGAPFWTLPACGIDPANITPTQSAIIHCEYPNTSAPDPASLPAMIWSTNYGRLLSQTLFTLFFAGRTFAPNCTLDGGRNIQDYLQAHFIEAFGQLADRIRVWDGGRLLDTCVLGWDSLNEPFEGLCGWADLNRNPTAQGSGLKKGTAPTPAQSLRLGMGQPQTVENWTFGAFGPARSGSVTIDPKGRKLWADPASEGPDGTHAVWGWRRDVGRWPLGTCIWALHGVWDLETGFVLRPDYFRFDPASGVEVRFIEDFWKRHWVRYSARLRRSHPEAIWFVQPPVFALPPQIGEVEAEVDEADEGVLLDDEEGGEGRLPKAGTQGLRGRCVYSPHYYDGLTLITRHWNWFNADALGVLRGHYSSPLAAVKIGEKAIRASIASQLALLKSDALLLGSSSSSTPSPPPHNLYPTLIGEIGTPFDMDSKRSYGWTDKGKFKGDYSRQVRALDASLAACEGLNGLAYTVWNVVFDDHSHEWGDGWNMEDLSLWSLGDVWGAGGGGDNVKGSKEDEEEERRAILIGDGEDDDAMSSRTSLVNRKRRRGGRGGGEQMKPSPGMQPSLGKKPSLAMLAAASSLSVASLGSVGSVESASTSRSGTVVAGLTPQIPDKVPSKLGICTTDSSESSSSSAASSRPSSPVEEAGIVDSSNPDSPTSNNTDNADPTPTPALLRKLGYHPNPFDFLIDGARAWEAFCRPFPVCSVGVPREVVFDIGRAVWRGVVWVRAEDRVVLLGCGEGERGVDGEVCVKSEDGVCGRDGEGEVQEGGKVREEEQGGEEGKWDKRYATEIYVPLVHFAHPRLLVGEEGECGVGGEVYRDYPAAGANPRRRGAGLDPKRRGAKAKGGVVVEVSSVTGGDELEHADREGVQWNWGGERVVPRVAGVGSCAGGSVDEVESDTDEAEARGRGDGERGGGDKDDLGLSEDDEEVREWEDGAPLVDVEVIVSEGRYRIEGQRLFWWYDVPIAASPSGPEEAEAILSVGAGSAGTASSAMRIASSASTPDLRGAKSSEKGKGKGGSEEGKEVSIEIRRRGGPVKKGDVERRRGVALRRCAAAASGSGRESIGGGASESTLASVGEGGKKGSGSGEGRGGGGGRFCDEMCPTEGCCVM